MTAPLLAPVIPPPGRRAAGGPGRTGQIRCLPVAAAPVVPAVADGVVYGLGRMDASGRVAGRAVTGALGWRAGDRLTLTAAAGVILARRGLDGMVTLPARPYIAIPAVLRRRCGLAPGAPVLLAALPGQDALAAYPLAVVDQALRAHCPLPGSPGGPS